MAAGASPRDLCPCHLDPRSWGPGRVRPGHGSRMRLPWGRACRMRGPDSQSGIMAFAMSGRSNSAEGKAKDVLAAEAFAVPAADPNLHPRGPILVPEDPSGIEEPHDVLAAEEFAMPASPRPRVSSTFT